jgi:thiol-disulfide isomerase/thioredoxin
MNRLPVALKSWIAVTVACGVCACGGDGAPARAPQVGDPLPALAFASLEGDSVAFAEFAGSPVLVNLWATWCPPCRAEIPFLQTIHEEFAPLGLRVVGISADNAGALGQVEEFLAEVGVTYENLLDPRGESMEAFRLLGLPATYLVDREGHLVLMRTGPVSEADEAFMEAVRAITAPETEGDG